MLSKNLSDTVLFQNFVEGQREVLVVCGEFWVLIKVLVAYWALVLPIFDDEFFVKFLVVIGKLFLKSSVLD